MLGIRTGDARNFLRAGAGAANRGRRMEGRQASRSFDFYCS